MVVTQKTSDNNDLQFYLVFAHLLSYIVSQTHSTEKICLASPILLAQLFKTLEQTQFNETFSFLSITTILFLSGVVSQVLLFYL